MPQIQRTNVPRRLLEHLLDRIRLREVPAEDLAAFAAWLDTKPEVPNGDWFKRLSSMTVCGQGALVTTFLAAHQIPIGQEM